MTECHAGIVTVICDGCSAEVFDLDYEDAVVATNEWVVDGDRHYCEECLP